jgi:hypothetical protein
MKTFFSGDFLVFYTKRLRASVKLGYDGHFAFYEGVIRLTGKERAAFKFGGGGKALCQRIG